MLAEVHDATGGSWDLGFLGTMPLEEARAWLTALPGIGRKTASIILLFGFGRPAMPVDTHVHRVATRLGMLPPRTPLDRAHDLLEEVLRPEEMYPFHVETIRHGRDTCSRAAADLRALPAHRRLRLLRRCDPRPRADGARPEGRGRPGGSAPLPRRAHPRLDAARTLATSGDAG